jgi:coiled-coil and C2 domain-containing protein 2A
MDLGKGDSEEHAMLLCNFFNYIDRENGRQEKSASAAGTPWNQKQNVHSYIIYGEAVPDGFCWFVCRTCKLTEFIEIWNPMNGEVYNFDRVKSKGKGGRDQGLNQYFADAICPMKKVWCVVGQENVWANIQERESPPEIIFDFDNKKHW